MSGVSSLTCGCERLENASQQDENRPVPLLAMSGRERRSALNGALGRGILVTGRFVVAGTGQGRPVGAPASQDHRHYRGADRHTEDDVN
jgi:hypothetical protein